VIVEMAPASDFNVIVSPLTAVTVPSSLAVDAGAVCPASANTEGTVTNPGAANAARPSAIVVFISGIQFSVPRLLRKRYRKDGRSPMKVSI
jgi:hypothetical protein